MSIADRSEEVLAALWECCDAHIAVYAAEGGGGYSAAIERFLAAAERLRCIKDVPASLPPHPRWPEHYNRIPPVQRITTMLYDAGNMLEQQRRDTEAIPFLERVIDLAPDDADAHRELGVALLCTDRPREALRHFSILAKLRPDLPEGYMAAGDCYMSLGNFRDAVYCYREAARVSPDDPRVRKRLDNLPPGVL